jgi:hypothetical protein
MMPGDERRASSGTLDAMAVNEARRLARQHPLGQVVIKNGNGRMHSHHSRSPSKAEPGYFACEVAASARVMCGAEAGSERIGWERTLGSVGPRAYGLVAH